MRANFGFNEPDLAIRHFVLQQAIAPPLVKAGICLRFWEELYLPPEVKSQTCAGLPSHAGVILHQF